MPIDISKLPASSAPNMGYMRPKENPSSSSLTFLSSWGPQVPRSPASCSSLPFSFMLCLFYVWNSGFLVVLRGMYREKCVYSVFPEMENLSTSFPLLLFRIIENVVLCVWESFKQYKIDVWRFPFQFLSLGVATWVFYHRLSLLPVLVHPFQERLCVSPSILDSETNLNSINHEWEQLYTLRFCSSMYV